MKFYGVLIKKKQQNYSEYSLENLYKTNKFLSPNDGKYCNFYY